MTLTEKRARLGDTTNILVKQILKNLTNVNQEKRVKIENCGFWRFAEHFWLETSKDTVTGHMKYVYEVVLRIIYLLEPKLNITPETAPNELWTSRYKRKS